MKKVGKREQKKAEQEAEAFLRQTVCKLCEITEDDGQKDSFTFRGATTYYCKRCGSFTHYVSVAGEYWRRAREQTQN